MNLFFDSSALVKRYVNEVGSAWVANAVDQTLGNTIHVAEITAVEITAAIARRTRGNPVGATGVTFDKLEFDLRHEYVVSAVTARVLQDAQALARKYFLRGYDAIQLAVALTLNRRQLTAEIPAITLVSADTELLSAALGEGLLIENPNDHS